MLCNLSVMAIYSMLEVNGVHQRSRITPALFNIYMEAVTTKMLRLCDEFGI